jgi:hypothetical protein
MEEYGSDPTMQRLDLTGYGTLASLSFHQIALKEGQFFEFVDPDGLSVKGMVFFDNERISKNCSGWFAKFSKADMSESATLDHDYDTHLCFKCRKNIKPHLDTVGRQFCETCPFCGTIVMHPLSPP